MTFMVIMALFLYTMFVWGSKKVVKRGEFYYVKMFWLYQDSNPNDNHFWWSNPNMVKRYCRIDTKEKAAELAFGLIGDEHVIERGGPENPLKQLSKYICNYIKECK